MEIGLKMTISNLTRYGRCPQCYGKVRYSHGYPSTFKCKNCKARLEGEHVAQGGNSLNRVNNITEPWFTDSDIKYYAGNKRSNHIGRFLKIKLDKTN